MLLGNSGQASRLLCRLVRAVGGLDPSSKAYRQPETSTAEAALKWDKV